MALLSFVALLSTAIWIAACAPPEALAPPVALAIVGVTLIDGVGDSPQKEMTVLVDGDRLLEIGAADQVAVPEGTPTVDGRGRFLIPGLWDAHVHLANVAEPAIDPASQLVLFLAHGVVAVRDMGSDWQRIQTLRQRLAAGEIRGPTIFSPGPFVDGPQDARPSVRPVNDADEAREAVRSLADLGVDFVKIQAGISREAYLAAIDEARKIDLPVHGHIADAVTAFDVARSGQRTMEHVSPAIPSDAGIFLSCSNREPELRSEIADLGAAWEVEGADAKALLARQGELQRAIVDTYDPQKAASLFTELSRNGISVVPTLIFSRTYSPPSADLSAGLPIDILPPKLREQWREAWDGYFSLVTGKELASNAQAATGSIRLVGDLHRARVNLLAGTDSTTEYVIPGFSLHQELEQLVAAGLTPAEALRAATAGPAELLGQLDQRGTIETGKVADLVLLEADPLADIRNTREIAAVVAGGVLHERSELDRMLAEIATTEPPPGRE